MSGLHDFTFFDVINRNAGSYGSHEAWLDIETDEATTFRQYREKVYRLASGLRKRGVEKGDRIGIIATNSLEYFLVYGAAAALGAIVLPLNWRLSSPEIIYNINDCTPKVLFFDSEHIPSVQGREKELPCIQEYFSMSSDQNPYPSFQSLMEYGDDVEPARICMEDGYLIIHTAALEGRPRGALLSHGNVMWANIHFLHLLNLTPNDVHLCFLPLFHVTGLFMTLAIFHAGALSLNMARFDALNALESIEKKKVSVMLEFPPVLSSILDLQEKTGTDISSLRAIGGLDSPETIERYQRLTGGFFHSNYGQTETSCLATFGRYDERPGAAGKPIPMADLNIVDYYDKEVGTGEVGEIVMRGPLVFQGYWNLTAENTRIFRGGWHHTGDLGRFDEEGFLWHEGRMPEKELIKPGGENVYPVEVEKAILEHPAIEKTVVFGVPDPKWKEGIKAVCQLKEGAHLEAKELISFVGQRIARYKKPQYVEFVPSLPLLKDGSPDRIQAKKKFGAA